MGYFSSNSKRTFKQSPLPISLLIELEMKEMCGKIVVDWENEKVKNR